MKNVRKIFDKLMQNIPLVFGISILTMDAIAIAAPILAHFGFTGIAHWIYYIYRFLCHQRPWRSLHLFDYQVAWCTRDVFIYLSMGLAALLVVRYKIRGVKWYWALLGIIPFALDGTIQFIAEFIGIMRDEQTFFYASTNFQRMLTGSIFGGAAGLWLFSVLDETIEEELSVKTKKEEKKTKQKNIKYYIIILITCLVFYLGFIQLWRITSEKYKPHGIFEQIRYYPGINYEEVGRGGHGV